MKPARATKDVAIASRSPKLQPAALPVRVVKRTAGGKRTMGGKR
jgi:hypothetical protein